ncbi:MAG TPA: hypothetical protein VGL76_00575 [Gaiellaceae bacterium]|jgi:hypothetical protein
MRTFAVTMLAVFALMLVQSAAGAATPNPCRLLTNAEVAKAIGSKVASRQTVHYAGERGHTCEWQGVNLSSASSYAVHRSLMIMATDVTRAQFLKSANLSQGAVRVDGIGQVAFREGNGNVTFLNVWQNGHSFSFIVGEVTNPLAAEKTAARLALGRV